MKNTILVVDITFRDDKIKRYECVDFPSYASDFITLYLPGFVTFRVRVETVLEVLQFFDYKNKIPPMAKVKVKAKAAKAAKATKSSKKKGK